MCFPLLAALYQWCRKPTLRTRATTNQDWELNESSELLKSWGDIDKWVANAEGKSESSSAFRIEDSDSDEDRPAGFSGTKGSNRKSGLDDLHDDPTQEPAEMTQDDIEALVAKQAALDRENSAAIAAEEAASRLQDSYFTGTTTKTAPTEGQRQFNGSHPKSTPSISLVTPANHLANGPNPDLLSPIAISSDLAEFLAEESEQPSIQLDSSSAPSSPAPN